LAYRLRLDHVAFLRSPDGVAALVQAAGLELTATSRLRDVATARVLAGERGPAVLETALLRRQAVGKLDDPQRWLLTDDALQQATASAVAAHRAQRLVGRAVHDVTCSIGAELVELASVTTALLGSDLDPVRLAMAAHNAPGVTLVRADALVPVSRDAVVLADPGRRSDDRRTHDPARLQPPLPELLSVHSGRDIVVKCAPGIDVDRLGWRGEVEVVSLDGGVREACLWSPGLSGAATRRATMLTSSGRGCTITDRDPDVPRCGNRVSGSSTRTARWCGPGWCGTGRRGTAWDSSTTASPISPETACRRGCVASGCSATAGSPRNRCARNSPGWTAAARRSSRVGWTWTPRCYGPGCACAGHGH